MSVSDNTVLLVGGNGMLAQSVSNLAPGGYSVHAVDLPEFDLTDQAQVQATVEAVQPQVIINCAAYTDVDGCETNQGLATEVNGVAVGYLAAAAKEVDAILVHVSTDYVFDGQQEKPYTEADQPNPQSAYGRTKLLGEQAVMASGLIKYFIVRTSWLYGLGGNNFVETILRLAAEREELRIVSDQVGSPTFTADLAGAIYRLLDVAASPQAQVSSAFGIYHFANAGQCSWYEFAKEIVLLAREAGLDLKVKTILPIKTEDYPLPATRPAYSVFDKRKYKQLTGSDIPLWQRSLKEYLTVRSRQG